MGIQVEFNPDLALRNIVEFKKGNRQEEECLPENLEQDKVYSFLKSGQRNYWLHGEIPLLETQGNEVLSRPKASIIILEATHFLNNNQIYTKGKYRVVKVLKEGEIYFESYQVIKK